MNLPDHSLDIVAWRIPVSSHVMLVALAISAIALIIVLFAILNSGRREDEYSEPTVLPIAEHEGQGRPIPPITAEEMADYPGVDLKPEPKPYSIRARDSHGRFTKRNLVV